MGTIGYPLYVDDWLVRIGGPAVPELLRHFERSGRGYARVLGAESLARIGPAARVALPSLIRAIVHRDPKPESAILVLYTVKALGRIGPEAKAAVPALNRLLDEDDDTLL